MTATNVLNEEEAQSFLKALGSRIRQLRKEKGLDMRAIMIASGYYDAQWRKYESGSSMNMVSLMRVASALDVSFSELLDGLGQWPRLTVEEIRAKHAADLDSDHEPESHLEPKSEPVPAPARRKAASEKTQSQKVAGMTNGAVVKKSLTSSLRQTTRGISTPRKSKS